MNLNLVCLQRHPEFIDECIELLNMEWPRSKTARLVSIQQGCPNGFPTALILVNSSDTDPDQKRVVAHAKVTLVSVHYPNSCFIESVVVDKNLRGKGLGRKIMEMTEEFLRSKGITTAFLTTHDQQGFYEKLGYTLCEPIVIFGGKCHSSTLKTNNGDSDSHLLERKMDELIIDPVKVKDSETTKSSSALKLESKDSQFKSTFSPPPPPPPPPVIGNNKRDDIKLVQQYEKKVTMKKVL